ncbi:unnamed protein product [Rotaria socialis]|uniref:Late endosomal/lysosomal adaptor and MAPK and MTOR activator 1 n=1 Tax=Rotaria socialis TaxID=392032 RepID=A0A818NA02_9BILA|nr:unnamed protein product [Rotaria socialis]CAF3675480.1 unnamed protein product [Rotaria socialis]CAF4510982.1 unnamed protein product [Rotaria socialis]CAF4606946.1 unnamed protein product [Rotaria socialis]
MGNICSWCVKNEDQSQSNGSLNDTSEIQNPQQTSVSAPKGSERTPLLSKSGNHNCPPTTPVTLSSPLNSEFLSVIPPPEQPVADQGRVETRTDSQNAHNEMARIVEGMFSKLIDVTGGGGSNIRQRNANAYEVNSKNDSLKQLLIKSLSSPKLLAIPDAGLNNLPSLLSGRPVSSEVCHYVAHTAGELSRLLVDEIRIVHKEQLVVVFE